MIKRNKARGFTLLELMVTVTVAGIVLSFGVPSFLDFMASNRTVARNNELVTALNLGRSEAIRSGAAVTVCSSTDAATCAAANDWSTGWIVVRASGEVVRVWPALGGGAGVLTANVPQIQFQGRGTIAGAAIPQLQLRLPHCSPTNQGGRNVDVARTGRISVTAVNCP